MTIHTIPHRPRMTAKSAALTLAAAGLAVGAALGADAVLPTDAEPVAPTRSVPDVVITDGARDSWEGRIGPDAERPEQPGRLTRAKLRQLR